jgi:hypothetical protein
MTKPENGSKEKQILTQRARADLVISEGALDFDGNPAGFFWSIRTSRRPRHGRFVVDAECLV